MGKPTKEEATWLRKMQKLLDQCPPRLGFYTVGDASLTVFNRDLEANFNEDRDMVHEVYDYDAVIGDLKFTTNVHGVCG